MPNWISGSLKVRGKPENVKKFFMEGLNKYEDYIDPKTKKYETRPIPREKWVKTDLLDPDGKEFFFNILDNQWIYVEDTRRAFITGEHEIYCYINDDDNLMYAASTVNQAWSFDPEDWMVISEKYHIDIRLYGLECGMGFGQEIEIIDGKLTLNTTFGYDNWTWECPFPWMGG